MASQLRQIVEYQFGQILAARVGHRIVWGIRHVLAQFSRLAFQGGECKIWDWKVAEMTLGVEIRSGGRSTQAKTRPPPASHDALEVDAAVHKIHLVPRFAVMSE